MATISQYPSGVADWATVCAWVRDAGRVLGSPRPRRRERHTRAQPRKCRPDCRKRHDLSTEPASERAIDSRNVQLLPHDRREKMST